MSKKYHIAAMFLLCLFTSPAWAVFSVHDSVLYVHNTVKAIQDEVYQQLNLDYQVEQLAETAKILKTSTDTLKVCKDTYDTAMDIYRTAEDLTGYVGDPAQMVHYVNSKFWYNRDIEMMLSVTKEAMSMADSSVVSIDDIESLLKKVDYAGREIINNHSRELAGTQKQAIAVRDYMAEWSGKTLEQVNDLNREDQKFKGREATLNEIGYANYKTNIHQANSLSQLLAVQSAAASLQAQQIHQENARQDTDDLDRAQELHDRYHITKKLSEKRENAVSLGNMFVNTYVDR